MTASASLGKFIGIGSVRRNLQNWVVVRTVGEDSGTTVQEEPTRRIRALTICWGRSQRMGDAQRAYVTETVSWKITFGLSGAPARLRRAPSRTRGAALRWLA
jgi:hypothetical protein